MKQSWNHILVFAEQVAGTLHPVVIELIGEAQKLAKKVGYEVYAVLVGEGDVSQNAERLLEYGVKSAFVYEDACFAGFRTDVYTNAVADCIERLRPSIVLIGGTAIGRSLAPRLSTRFKTGLTADCTSLDIRENTDLVQVRPAFGGDIMARILIENTRPQFATVRYKVMEQAKKIAHPTGVVQRCEVTQPMRQSQIELLAVTQTSKTKTIEEEEILVVAGRGVKNEKDLDILRDFAAILGAQLCFTRPLVEMGWGEQSHQIGLSGRTVKPKLMITCGVSGAIQFASCMKNAECIVAINTDEAAPIFNIAHYCVKGNWYEIIPALAKKTAERKAMIYGDAL